MRKALHIIACVCASAMCASAQSQIARAATPGTQQIASASNPNTDKMSNSEVVELAGIGLSDDVIIDKIYASKATNFDTSIAGLKALKAAKISDAVIRAMINPLNPIPQTSANTIEGAGGGQTLPAPGSGYLQNQEPAGNSQLENKPRAFFQSASHGTNQNASRDQSMEMSKDFEQDCPAVQITISQQLADYTIVLNHIEVGLVVRDNQIQIADKNGDLISRTKEGGSIRAGMKKACGALLDDWAKKTK